MATKLTNVIVTTTTGVKDPNTDGTPALAKYPEGGATLSARVSVGGAAVVELLAWVESGAKEVVATYTLPVPSGDKAGDLYDTEPINSIFDDFEWNVVSITGTLTLSLVGVGI